MDSPDSVPYTPRQSYRPSRPVLLVTLATGFGGAEVRVLIVARALHGKRRYAVAVRAGSRLHQILAEEGLNVVAMPYARGDPRNLLRLERLIRMNGFEVVDAHNVQSHVWGLGAAQRAGARVKLWTAHSDDREAGGGGWKPRVLRGALEIAKRWDCRFLAVSQPIFDYLCACGVDPRRVVLSPNGIPPPRIDPPTGLRARLGWQANPVIAVVARLDPVKGHRILFESLAALGTDEVCCLVIGDGSERDVLQATAARLGLARRVHFAGFRTDVPALLRECDIFCLPSLTEGLPFAVLEAAQLAIPLLLTRVGELPDAFRHGETARFAPPGDPRALAQELSWFLSHTREAAQLGRNAKRLVETRFAPEQMIAQTLEIYDHA